MYGSNSEDAVQRMMASMVHRGPDAAGFFSDSHYTCGIRRLKIIDLLGSEQPMYNEDRTLVLVCNGEIYNNRELRERLIAKGHHFQTRGDIEPIVHLYEEYGEEFVHQLHGMFALALWDSRRDQLILVRDRLGIKPLYWMEQERTILFASELRAFLASGLVEAIPDERAIAHYMCHPSVPAPLTIFRNINALLPGYMMIVKQSGTTLKEYWDVPLEASEPGLVSEEDILEEVRESLIRAVKMRLMSDVPLGAFLSGGIDSSCIVALMGRMLDRPVRTFCIRFTGEEKGYQWFDDASFAMTVARKFGTEHTEEVVTGQDVANNLLEAVWAMDQPSGDAIQHFMLAKSARKCVTVALSGTGGDEVFAGYEWFKKIRKREHFHKFVNWLTPRAALKILAQLQQLRTEYYVSPTFRRIENVLHGRKGFLERYRLDRRMHRSDDLAFIFSPAFWGRLEHDSVTATDPLELYGPRSEGFDPITRISYLQLKTDMVNLLVRDQDAVSMAHSLEVRLPLIDHHLVETVLRLPAQLKLKGNQEKYILRQAMSHVLPNEITTRRKKGFIVPLNFWMLHELRPVITNCLSRASIEKRGIFNPDTVDNLCRDFFQGKQPFFKVWNLAVFELWCRIVLDRKDGWKKPEGTLQDYL